MTLARRRAVLLGSLNFDAMRLRHLPGKLPADDIEGGIYRKNDAQLIYNVWLILTHAKEPSWWIAKLRHRRSLNEAAVALANKMEDDLGDANP